MRYMNNKKVYSNFLIFVKNMFVMHQLLCSYYGISTFFFTRVKRSNLRMGCYYEGQMGSAKLHKASLVFSTVPLCERPRFLT